MMKRLFQMRLSIIFLFVSLLLGKVKSDPLRMSPNPQHYQEVNSDGSVTPLMRLVDDGEDIYEETLEGYRVESIDGIYKYLEVDPLRGDLVDSGITAGKDNPNQSVGKSGNRLKKHIKKTKKNGGRLKGYKEPNRRAKSEVIAEEASGIPEELRHYSRRVKAVSGIVKNLVVPFKFSDHRSRPVPSNGDLNILMNHNGPHPLCPTGSVRDVYLISSYGNLQLESVVTPWVTLPGTESYYANGSSGLAPTGKSQEMIRDALNALESMWFDFRPFDVDRDGYVDAIAFLHSGYSAEWGGSDAYGTYFKNRIWSHKWTLYQLPTAKWTSIKTRVSVYNYHISPTLWGTSGKSIGRIGVIAHETGHFFGLPDLYDYDGGGNGIGSYGLMASCWGFDNSQYYPPHMSPWSKIQLGWVVPSVIRYSGRYAIQRSCDYPSVYMIKHNFPANEYLLIENRQRCHYDSAMVGVGGLAIYHIDENASYNSEGFPGQTQWPKNANHYRVALLQADGNFDLERGNNRGDAFDLFRSGGVSGIGPRGTYSSKGMLNTYPNTNAYQGGVILQTGVSINQISPSEDVMTFTVTLGSGSTGISSSSSRFSSGTSTATSSSMMPTSNFGVPAHTQPSHQYQQQQQLSTFEIILVTDSRGFETGWELIRLNAPDGAVVVDHRSTHTYKNSEPYLEIVPLPLPQGGQVDVYEFIITDLSGDGICCGQGSGSYALILDNVTVVSSGGIFGSKEVTYFTVGSTNGDYAEKQWLTNFEMEKQQKGLPTSEALASIEPSISPPVNLTWIPPTLDIEEDDPLMKQQPQQNDDAELWTIISYDDFEYGLGNFVYEEDNISISSATTITTTSLDGEVAAFNVYAHQGMSALTLYDRLNRTDSSAGAALSCAAHKSSYDVTQYTQLLVTFWYYALLAPSTNYRLLFLEYSADGGENWSVVQAFPLLKGHSSNNPHYYDATSLLDRHLVVFSTQSRLRFRFDLIVQSSEYSTTKDWSVVYIDEVKFMGK